MKLKALFVSMLVFLFAGLAMAQDPSGLPAMIPDDQFVKMLFASLGGLSGLSALGIAAAIVQLVVAFLSTNLMGKLWQGIDGIWKIIVIMSLTAVSGVLTMVSQGVSVGAALIHTTTLSALMVLGNQIYQHFTQPKPPAVS